MVFIGAVNAQRSLRRQTGDSWLESCDFCVMTLVVLGLHSGVLVTGYGLAKLAGMSRASCIAVAFAGSQKTLMVGLYVALRYYGGLAILPMVAYHVGQLMLDTLVADAWGRLGEQEDGPQGRGDAG